ncbi:hypothetical protein J6590_014525 [Homalodisca vitripennis]|nr:hypothetical protein J6590_014525 [Homalodisca vitripennis]
MVRIQTLGNTLPLELTFLTLVLYRLRDRLTNCSPWKIKKGRLHYKEQKEHTHGEQEMTDNVECASTDTLRSSYSPWDRLLLLQYCDDSTIYPEVVIALDLVVAGYGDDSTCQYNVHGEQEMTDNVECASTDTLRSSYSPWDRLLLLRYGDDSTMSLQCTRTL